MQDHLASPSQAVMSHIWKRTRESKKKKKRNKFENLMGKEDMSLFVLMHTLYCIIIMFQLFSMHVKKQYWYLYLYSGGYD